ncbi:nonstructural protein [Blackfly microvirus SF02]|uniref:Nonstructural protein n=1 Tax=Blackfly microvirus SF02 TaxID=2576452 RepID=A0A4V1F5G4_9VIRU|nr:nonstructural protein [Blackfly microvirus SF02]
MILKAYSLLDTKTGSFAVPFFMHHDALAVRAVMSAATGDSTSLSEYPEDYMLYNIGEYDDQIGQLFSRHHVCLGNIRSLLSAGRSNLVEAAQ